MIPAVAHSFIHCQNLLGKYTVGVVSSGGEKTGKFWSILDITVISVERNIVEASPLRLHSGRRKGRHSSWAEF
ncbi:MAG: hypothetical protein J7K71_04960 [Candidatus Omnitrophica bacterium]|nr:hypothetical protein [Candidatus Omnitrophota bacterium]